MTREQQLYDMLQRKRQELLTCSRAQPATVAEALPDSIEDATRANERRMVYEVDNVLYKLLQQVELAMRKLVNSPSTFGICAHCEDPISEQRLAALPWAELCVGCQSTVEMGGM